MLTVRQRKWTTAALCVSAIVAVLIIVSLFVPLYGEICSKSEQTGHEECTRHHIALVLFIHIAKALDAAGVVVTAFATGFIAWFTWTLGKATDRLWEAGEKQLALSRDIAERQLRAYVLVKDATFVESPQPGRPWEVNLTLENYGQTPAYGAKVRLSKELGPAKPSDTVLTLGADVKPLGQLPIPPRNPQIIRNTCAEWHSELIRWNDIARNKREAYIWGRVDYSDIDGNPCFTTFQMVNRFGAALSFSFCEKGNETDRRPARIDRAERDDTKTS